MNTSDFLISQAVSIREAMMRINATNLRTLFVIDSQSLLKGSLTEGDVLRFLMNGGVLSSKVSQAMNTNPVRSDSVLDRQKFIGLSKKHGLLLLPIVDELNRVTSVQSLWELL